MQNNHHTHIMNCNSPWLVAVGTRGFICVPEEEVSEVHPTMHLKQRTTLSDGFNAEALPGFSEEKHVLPACVLFLLVFKEREYYSVGVPQSHACL